MNDKNKAIKAIEDRLKANNERALITYRASGLDGNGEVRAGLGLTNDGAEATLADENGKRLPIR